MRRTLGALAVASVLAVLQVSNASATSPSPCPSPSSASAARTGCPTPNPNQAAYDLLRSRLTGDVASALDAEHRLATALDQAAAGAQTLTHQIAHEETVIANVEEQIAQLNARIDDTQARIVVEKQQLSVMTRAIYRQPDSFWLLVARTGSLREALIATADLVVAGQRAHDLQTKLEVDLARLQTDLQARQDQLDQENTTRDMLVSNLSALQALMSQQNDLSSQLADVVTQIKSAQSTVQNQPPDVTTSLAQLLEAQEQDLILRSYQAAWSQAEVGAGLALITNVLPLGKTLKGLILSWPMTTFQISQPFGPSSVLLEPPLGQYKHFHTGIDMAAPQGTPVMAAADGLVVAVGHTPAGYGNFVVIAHGGGVETLYGHLLATKVNVGDLVMRGRVIGLEGSTGFSTGPHLHFELRVNDQVVDPMPYLPVPGTNWPG